MFTLSITFMFLSVTKPSTAINSLRVDAVKNQAIVEFSSGAKYLYNDVDFSALYNLVYRQVDSIGAWVNANLKADSVQCVAL